MRSRNLKLAGVILNGPSNPENREAIELFGKVKVIDEIKPINPLSKNTLLQATKTFDREGILKPYFQQT
jgi:dethiobiotin synthetase